MPRLDLGAAASRQTTQLLRAVEQRAAVKLLGSVGDLADEDHGLRGAIRPQIRRGEVEPGP